MRKKLIMALLLVSLVMFSATFVLAACGNDDPQITEETGTSHTIEVGENYTISPKYENSTFTSENTAIVTVTESGTVYGVAEGTAKVYENNTTVRVTYTITVVPAVDTGDDTVYTVSLDRERVIGLTIGDDLELNASVLADGAASSEVVTWSVANADGSEYTASETVTIKAEGNKVTVTAAKAGDALVVATYNDVTASCLVTVQNADATELDEVTADVKHGDKVTWNEVANAEHYYVSEDKGATWTLNDERSYAINNETPRAYTIWIKAEGDGVNYAESVAEVEVRTQMYLSVEDDVLSVVGDGSASYELYNGSDKIADITSDTETELSDLNVATGDYSFTVQSANGKTSNACEYSTGFLNKYEMNSFDSSKFDAGNFVTSVNGNSSATYSNKFVYENKGQSLQLDLRDTYNFYTIPTSVDMSTVDSFYFYIYIDSESFMGTDGVTPIEAPELPPFSKNAFVGNSDGNNQFPFAIELARGESWAYDKWIRLEGTRDQSKPVSADTYELTLFAFANSNAWTGVYDPAQGGTGDSALYFYSFYLDEFSVYRDDLVASIEDDGTLSLTMPSGVTAKLYDESGETCLVENLTDGYSFENNYSALGITGTGDYVFIVEFYENDVVIGSSEVVYSTKFINEREVNSFDSSKTDAKGFITSGNGQSTASYSTDVTYDGGRQSLRLDFRDAYNFYTIPTAVDMSTVNSFYFYIYIDSSSFTNNAGVPLEEAPALPPFSKNAFVGNSDGGNQFPFAIELARGGSWAYDKWIRLEGTRDQSKPVEEGTYEFTLFAFANSNAWTGDYNLTKDSAMYFYTFYLDEIYTYRDDVSASVADGVLSLTMPGGITAKLYDESGSNCLVEDLADGYNFDEHLSALGITETGDYGYVVKFYENGELVGSDDVIYSTKNINEREINSFESSRIDASTITTSKVSKTSYSNDIYYGDSGRSLRFEVLEAYNYYDIPTDVDMSTVEKFYFYIYIDGNSFKNGEGTPVEAPDITRKEPFVGEHNEGRDPLPFAVELAAGQKWECNTWIRLEGTRRSNVSLTDNYKINLFAFTTPWGWTGTYTNDSPMYFYTFYLDNFSVYNTDVSASVADGVLSLTKPGGITAKLYDESGSNCLVEDLADGYNFDDNLSALGITETGDYKFIVNFYENGEFVGTSEVVYSTKNLNNNELNSFNSSRTPADGIMTSPSQNSKASYSTDKAFANNGQSLRFDIRDAYNFYTIPTAVDMFTVDSFYFYIYIDSTAFMSNDGVTPIEAPELPPFSKNAFVGNSDGNNQFPFAIELARGESWAYDKWIRLEGTRDQSKPVNEGTYEFTLFAFANSNAWTGVYDPAQGGTGDSALYFYTFYLDEFYTYNSEISATITDGTLSLTMPEGVTAQLYDLAGENKIADVTNGYSLDENLSALGITATGDYYLTINFFENGERIDSRRVLYSTANINENEINSFDSSRVDASTINENAVSQTSYSSDVAYNNQGQSLRYDIKDGYNYYNIPTEVDMSTVNSFYFYIYIDSESFMNNGGTESVEAPTITRKEPFVGEHNEGRDPLPFAVELASGEGWGYNKWIRMEGTRRPEIALTNNYQINLFAFATNWGWNGSYTNDNAIYWYTFYLDNFYINVAE